MSAAVPRRRGALVLAVVLSLLAVGVAAAAGPNVYTVKTLVTDASDASLVNGWGISAGPTTPWWVSDNGTNNTTLYSGTGAKIPLTVAVPGGPTGQVFNGNANGFKVTQGAGSAAARFIFATEAGTILGWAPTVSPATAIPGVDHSVQGSVY